MDDARLSAGCGDSIIYGDLAKNMLLHHSFAITDGSGVIHSTLIRLPGYPIFLAACFRLFGVANYKAVAWLQIVLELCGCLLLADFVRSIQTARAGLNTLWLAAMCPFTAVYACAPLTESLTFDMICLALWSLERYLRSSREGAKPRLGYLFMFTVAISYAALLRPDGAILAFALWPALIFGSGKPGFSRFHFGRSRLFGWAMIAAFVSILPFAAWGGRNWLTFHVVEPLAPRYANDPGEDPHLGWQHWVKTWCLDFTCTEEVYWNVPDSALDFNALPHRAWDSAAQQAYTASLVAKYNENQELSPELDAQFEALARQRAHDYPARMHLLMPLGRLADMTLRPRVENLTIDLRWWQYRFHRAETRFSWVYAAVNVVFFVLGIFGFCLRPRFWPCMVAYLILRSLLLLTIEAPETRYTLEFFPMLFAAGGVALAHILGRTGRGLLTD